MELKDHIHIYQSFIQYRISSFNSSGIVNIIHQSPTLLVIIQCKLTGSNLIQSTSNGYISSQQLGNVEANMTQFQVCIDNTSRFGQQIGTVIIDGNEIIQCDICGVLNLVYGLCVDKQLQFSEFINGSYKCVYPFEYILHSCICADGYLLNGTQCISILDSLTKSQNGVNQQIQQQLQNIQQVLTILDQSIYNNASVIQQYIGSNITTLESYIISNYSKSDINLLSNTTVLDWRIYNNITALNKLLTDMNQTITQLNQKINCSNTLGFALINGSCVRVTCSIIGQQSINGVCQCTNINQIVQNGSCVCPENSQVFNGVCMCTISGQEMINGECVCSTQGAQLSNGSCACGGNQQNISNVCSCPVYSTLINGTCVCDQIMGQSFINGSCECTQLGYTVVSNRCILTSFVLNIKDLGFVCSQQVYTTIFSISTSALEITGASNFTTGYVFNTATIIQDSLIDIADNVYAIMNPLFQSQISFTNIQIQFGSQTVTNGYLLSNNKLIAISQMNIISKNNSQFTVSSGQLSILSQTNDAKILNLLVNLSFALAHGNISLIKGIFGTLDIKNYQISGNYSSYNCVSLISLYSEKNIITANNINFMPTTFCVGRSSSYFFGHVENSSVSLIDIAYVLGNSSLYSELTSQNSTNDYYFGGIVCRLVGSTIQVDRVISSCYQAFTTVSVRFTGLLFGTAFQNSNSVRITNACMQWSLESTAQFSQFGVAGLVDGNFSILKSQISMNISLRYHDMIGIVGQQTDKSQFSEASNVIASLNLTNGVNSNAGTIFGINAASTKRLTNIVVNNSNIQTNSFGGGLISEIYLGTSLVQNVTVQFSNISSTISAVGGFFGWSSSTAFTIQEANINSVRVLSGGYIGLFLGQISYGNTFNIQNTSSIGQNYVNNVQIAPCAIYKQTIVNECV
ncbi:Conserved_hypothetical protein [Hexamita inflata]|uniref:Transmembrane protein n=1 Tax=Hexamita inflata TaxID=28002 RepID=A0ABP1HYV1_9EUKA